VDRLRPRPTDLSFFYTIHDLAVLLFLLLLIVHIYLVFVVNPETLRRIFGGYVRWSWQDDHHPDA